MTVALRTANSSARVYTLAEVDEMREAIFGILTFDLDTYCHSELMNETRERLRTYMIGNVDPQEIFTKYASMKAARVVGSLMDQPIVDWHSC